MMNRQTGQGITEFALVLILVIVIVIVVLTVAWCERSKIRSDVGPASPSQS